MRTEKNILIQIVLKIVVTGLMTLAIDNIILANNLTVNELSYLGSQKIRCRVSWENSWKLAANESPANHDAVWLFAKIRPQGGTWQHLNFSNQNADHWSELPLSVSAVSDGKGVFISRNEIGSGVLQGFIELQVTDNQNITNFELKICAIEMVYIPEGGFWLGDSASKFTLQRGDQNAPFYVSSNAAINIGTSSETLLGATENYPAQAIPTTYPKGFSGFYCMKYEITQEQYADFLNTLTTSQQSSRINTNISATVGTPVFTAGNTFRNGIVIAQPSQNGQAAIFACNANGNQVFNEDSDGQNRACNWLNWADLTAYLDWAALRPMSELEFEKAARGTSEPLRKEMAWGTNLVTDANNTQDDGTPNERVSETVSGLYGIANHSLPFGQNYLLGVLRSGFAASDQSNRRSMGASFYGVAELSGNVWETCVSVNTIASLQFTATEGDGELSNIGDANATTWPAAQGAINRGGGWNSLVFNDLDYEFRDLAISDRFYANTPPTTRRNTAGGRGVRSF